MEKSTSISEMQKFHFGTKIFCSDGEDGSLLQVVFDPASRRMTHLGVRLGRLFSKTVYVPFGAVTEANGEAIILDILRVDLAAAGKEEPSGALLDNRSIVQHSESSAKGSLLLVAVEPGSGELSYIVAHHLRPGQNTMLRQDVVKSLASDQITVSLPEATLQTLPVYRVDSELQSEVEAILFSWQPLHVDLKGMTVRVLDSVLYLDGNISSLLRSDIVQDQALGVQGLLEIKNRLVADDTLAADLARALGRDSRTRELPIGVYPRLGVVRLSGYVHNEQQRVAAEEIASSFPGVRSVTNDLVVRPNADLLHALSPAEVSSAEEIVPGKYIRHTK